MAGTTTTTTTSSTTTAAFDPSQEAAPTTGEAILKISISAVVLIGVAIAYHCIKRERAGNLKTHGIYVAVSLLVIFTCPAEIASLIFSGLTVTLVGTVFPIYESVRAICTPTEDDDKDWLQYWLVGGIIFILTEWVDDVIGQDNPGVLYWYETSFFFFLWLFFPKTDGAALLYDKVTEPIFGPRIKQIQKKMNNWIQVVYHTTVNAAYLWVVYLFFMFLPAGLKRGVAVAVGVAYPWVSSMAAAATEEVEDDTYWLTYWSAYGILFIMMDILETWLGWVPGFYTLIILCTVYLMLPMIQGAEKVFRKVLVPMAGLTEMLLLRDAMVIKKNMMKDLDPTRQEALKKAILNAYQSDNTDPDSMKKEFQTSYRNLFGFLGNGSSSSNGGDKKEADESTSLV